MRSGATSSRRQRRRIVALGLVVLAGVAAGGAVVVVPRIERDLDRRISRSLARAGIEVDAPISLRDGVYRADTLGLWLAGLVAAAVVGLLMGVLLGRLRRRPVVDPDDAALLRQGWRVDPLPVAVPVSTVPQPMAIPDPVPPHATEVPIAAASEPVAVAAAEPEIVIPIPPLLVEPVRARPAAPPPPVRARPTPERNDLTVISGIDPDVADLLRVHGIATWGRLGDTEVGELRSILDSAGPRFAGCQPGTWPIQARLLADGDWNAFRRLADGLRDGRPIWR